MNQQILKRLELSGTKPLASGSYRQIYQHPFEEALLIKVLRQKTLNESLPWYKSMRRGGPYRAQYREQKEYRLLQKRNLHDLPFIQKYIGKVDTDLGPGMAVEKLVGRDGKLAPTITEIVQREGLSESLRQMLIELRDMVIGYNVIFSDVRSNNIVLAHDRHGDRLVIIDGLGDRLWLPVNSMSAKINRFNRRRHFERAFEKIDSMHQEYLAGRAAP